MARKNFIKIAAAIVLGVFFGGCNAKLARLTNIRIGTTSLVVQEARTDHEREEGLSGRDSLDGDRGMLFIFERKERYPFWMKRMKFPLDFIWIEDDKVVDITENVPVFARDGSFSIVIPSKNIDAVLEVNAGFVKSHKIGLGDKFEVLR